MFEVTTDPYEDQLVPPFKELVVTDIDTAERMTEVAAAMDDVTATVLFRDCEEDPDSIAEAQLLARAYAASKEQAQPGEMGSSIVDPNAWAETVRRTLSMGGAVVWLSFERDGMRRPADISWPFYKQLRTTKETE
jgi:hypothetical protein